MNRQIVEMKAKDLMRTKVVVVDADVSVAEAMNKMLDNNITSLIVKKKENLEYGIITRQDIVTTVIAYGRDPKNVDVREVMSDSLLIINPDMEMENIALVMARTGIRRFPVFNGDRMVGMVSNSDLLKVLMRNLS
ncbi:MAG: CBS domain-containing protein [Candidatus Heimdallarchaeota archaeon]|nr:CBS domain-containing protein [Candidatus Heimdallarchaeota archaeon]